MGEIQDAHRIRSMPVNEALLPLGGEPLVTAPAPWHPRIAAGRQPVGERFGDRGDQGVGKRGPRSVHSSTGE